MPPLEIIDYYIAASNYRHEVIGTTIKYIQQGWQPYGPLTSNKDAYYVQPLVKYKYPTIKEI